MLNTFRSTIVIFSAVIGTMFADVATAQKMSNGITDTFTHKGNVFIAKSFADTATMLDPVTTEVYTVINNPSPIPVKLNGVSIYGKNEVDRAPSVTENTLKAYILHHLKDHLAGLADGEYRMILNSVVLNERGKVVFYDYIAIERGVRQKTADVVVSMGSGESRRARGKIIWKDVPAMRTQTIYNAIDKILSNTPKYTPAVVYGNAVPCRLSDEAFKAPFYLKGGVVYHGK